MRPRNQALEVWGEFACFSQPAFKVERFSYPLITPSAARGIFDAIYCKKDFFRWRIKRIDVLAVPAYIALRRNEVKEKISVNAVIGWAKGQGEPTPLWADGDRNLSGSDEKGRTQRQTMALKDVRYRIHAEILPWNGFEDRIQSFESQFRRRAAQGKCIYQPYLGCREFPAYFELITAESLPAQPVAIDMDLGLMLYDVFDLSRPGGNNEAASISLFRATVREGVMTVPDYGSMEVYRGIEEVS